MCIRDSREHMWDRETDQDRGNGQQHVRLGVSHDAELFMMHPCLAHQMIEVRTGMIYFHFERWDLIHSFTRRSRISSGSAPSRRTKSWKARTSNFAASSRSARARNSFSFNSPIL